MSAESLEPLPLKNMGGGSQCVYIPFVLRCGCVMDCHATTWCSIPGGNSVKTELHDLRKGQ